MEDFEQYQLRNVLTCILQNFTEEWAVFKSNQPIQNESRLPVTENVSVSK